MDKSNFKKPITSWCTTGLKTLRRKYSLVVKICNFNEKYERLPSKDWQHTVIPEHNT